MSSSLPHNQQSGNNSVNENGKLVRFVSKFKCCHCFKDFYSPTEFKKHMRSHGDRPYQCDQCAYAAPVQSRLNRHIREVHDKYSNPDVQASPAPRKYKCKECKYTGIYRNVTTHMRTVHKRIATSNAAATVTKKVTPRTIKYEE